MDDALSDVVARLYAGPPEEFVAIRAEAVKAAKDAGDRARAAEIGKLRKPTVGAWLVNLLAHQRPDLIADLLALGDEMRSAQRELRGAELRELSQRRRETVSALARETRSLAVAAGRGARDPLPLAEVESTLIAALADPEVAEDVRAGRLTKTVEYAGFGETPRPQLRLLSGGLDASPSRTSRADKESLPDRTPESDIDHAQDHAQDHEQAEDEADGSTRAASSPRARAVPTIQPGPTGRRPAGREEPADREADRDAARRGPAGRGAADRDVAELEAAELEAAERLAVEQERRQTAEREAERAAATERRKARASAHRELLAARTQLAEAEAARTAAERSVLEARRRVEKALARATAVDDTAPTDGRRGTTGRSDTDRSPAE